MEKKKYTVVKTKQISHIEYIEVEADSEDDACYLVENGEGEVIDADTWEDPYGCPEVHIYAEQ